jgi:uncharacterized protein (TIGR03435 family)
MRLVSTLISAWIVLAPVASGLRAQTAEPRPAFEVVSIKLLEGVGIPSPFGRDSIDAGRVNYPNITLKQLIGRAYGVPQVEGPSWVVAKMTEANFYSVSAKIPDGSSEKQVPAMLQTMLADRFALKMHWESRMQPVFALVVGKGELKLKKSDLTIARRGPDGRPIGMVDGAATGHFAFKAYTMAQFVSYLGNLVGRPVLDMTEIQGEFDCKFDASLAGLASMRQLSAAADVSSDDNLAGGSIFDAMQALGLKLESRKASIQHLVVDSALKVPTAN